jgi:O-acetyl-ADP-ribose deacetylase (regulator of RNase III)
VSTARSRAAKADNVEINVKVQWLKEGQTIEPLNNALQGTGHRRAVQEGKESVDEYVLLKPGMNATIKTQMSDAFHKSDKAFWTHPSVVAFAKGGDPVQRMISVASSVALDAIQAGWSGPPYDPFRLADYLRIRVVPSDSVSDARILPEKDRYQIQFNPNRPKGRIRYSVAHDLAHTLFSDCGDTIRHRLTRQEQAGDDWQLEMLCNIGAAEFLMPVGSFPELNEQATDIDRLLQVRAQFEVSTEATLLRVTRRTEQPCAMFAASRIESGEGSGRYRLDYWVSSRSWPTRVPSGSLLPRHTALPECTAIGFTSKGDEQWPNPVGRIHVECVGINPYPAQTYPRVVGMVRPLAPQQVKAAGINIVRGDATEPRGQGPRILAHVVNDKAALWGAGFGLAVRRKWPHVQTAFRDWATKNPANLRLGNVFMSTADRDVTAFQMVCQHGYGPSPKPRLRYSALQSCLEQLARSAEEQRATIHMPRIGAGQAGGLWGLISQLVDEVLCSRGLRVTVYDLPEFAGQSGPAQSSLFGMRI